MKKTKSDHRSRDPKLALLVTNLENAFKAASVSMNELIRGLQYLINNFDIEQACKDYYSAIITSANKGITNREMKRRRPFTRYQYDHDAIIKSLIEAGKIEYAVIPKNKQGRLRKVYIATDLLNRDEQASSSFKKVCWSNDSFKWVAQAKTLRNNAVIEIGHYDTESEAIKEYNIFIAKYPGKFPI